MRQPFDEGKNCWQVAAASACGTSHKRMGLFCQDAHCWKLVQEYILVAAVADGAGSAPFADIGASIASQTAVETIRSQLDNLPLANEDMGYHSLLTDGIRKARAAVEIEAKSRGVEARDLATTLILLIAAPEVIAAVQVQVGDGAVVAGDRADNIVPITRPQFGEYINETTFITSTDAIETAQVGIWRGDVTHIAALSDGLQMLALNMPEGTPHAPFFLPLFQFHSDMTDTMEAQAEVEAFLGSARVTERTDDDLTLLLAKLAG